MFVVVVVGEENIEVHAKDFFSLCGKTNNEERQTEPLHTTMGNAADKADSPEKADTLDHLAITGKGKISEAEKKKIMELYGCLSHNKHKQNLLLLFFEHAPIDFSVVLVGRQQWTKNGTSR